MGWQFDGQRPIYAQLLEGLELRILSGMYPPGSRLASVRELAAEAAVNPNTMQRALAELERFLEEMRRLGVTREELRGYWKEMEGNAYA